MAEGVALSHDESRSYRYRSERATFPRVLEVRHVVSQSEDDYLAEMFAFAAVSRLVDSRCHLFYAQLLTVCLQIAAKNSDLFLGPFPSRLQSISHGWQFGIR